MSARIGNVQASATATMKNKYQRLGRAVERGGYMDTKLTRNSVDDECVIAETDGIRRAGDGCGRCNRDRR
jgi:hypothetical protein